MIDLTKPLNLNDSEATDFLSNLQGNILKGHGRDYTSHMLLRFNSNSGLAKEWISEFAKNEITSAHKQINTTEKWRLRDSIDVHGEIFAMFLLSAKGYLALGIPDDDIPNDRNNSFKNGMSGALTKDPLQSDWEEPYNSDIHAMVLLAHDEKNQLRQYTESLYNQITTFCENIHIEDGQKLIQKIGGKDIAIEHFGYADGISQPILIKQDIDRERKERGNSNWDPGAPLELALVQEKHDSQTFGSFMVFRKLEQNVFEFKKASEELADALKLTGEDRDRAGALAVGRFKDGRPLIHSTANSPNSFKNDFNFDEDTEGKICPFHSHIRKSNPRGDLSRRTENPISIEVERRFRIVRRGITYGLRPDLDKGLGSEVYPPKEGVGLLFMCFQGNLLNFEIQQDGSDADDFVQSGVGVDAITGRGPTQPQNWPGTELIEFSMSDFVTLKGGEYFHAPSIPFLKTLNQVKD